jgi:hypothetical protein
VAHLLRGGDSPQGSVGRGAHDWITRPCFDKRKRCIVVRNETESVSFVEVHRSEFGLTDPRRVLQYRLEHWLQFAGRARNDLQHVGGGGLLLQRLSQLLQQARVLDRHHGLGGKILNQMDLSVGKRTNYLAVNDKRADKVSML